MNKRSVLFLGVLFNLLVSYTLFSQTYIPLSDAYSSFVPQDPGNGINCYIYFGIGGGEVNAYKQSLVDSLIYDVKLVSPYIDFPSKGETVTFSESTYEDFFANTVQAPSEIKDMTPSGFMMKCLALLKVTEDLDTDPSTEAIDLRIDVGSDDGYRLLVGGNLLGYSNDRAFEWSSHSVSFEGAGLYVLYLLFSANEALYSGIELKWLVNDGDNNIEEFIPQSSMYYFRGDLPFFVSPDGSAESNGTGWANTTSLKAALESARELLKKSIDPVDIWLLQGTYIPDDGYDTNESFEIPGNVRIYGGFGGSENSLDERNPLLYKTILSGDISGLYNSKAVVSVVDSDSSALLDGIEIHNQRPSSVSGYCLKADRGEVELNNCTLSYVGNGKYSSTIYADGSQIVMNGTTLVQDGNSDTSIHLVDSELRNGFNNTYGSGQLLSFDSKVTGELLYLESNQKIVSETWPRGHGEAISDFYGGVIDEDSFFRDNQIALASSIDNLYITGKSKTWIISNGVITWYKSPLLNINYESGFRSGSFGSGGEIRIYGELFELDNDGNITEMIDTDGEQLLLEAAVGEFELVVNPDVPGSFIPLSGVELTVSGGYLTDNYQLTTRGKLAMSLELGSTNLPVIDFSDQLDLVSESSLSMTILPGYQNSTIIESAIIGSGTIECQGASQMEVHKVDLSGNSESAIIVSGELKVDGLMSNTNIEILDAPVLNKGEVFYDDVSGILVLGKHGLLISNDIISEGDQYIIFEEDEPDLTQLFDNKISLLFNQGRGSDAGMLLEARSIDSDNTPVGANPGAYSGIFKVSSDLTSRFSDELANNWLLEELVVLPSARLNLIDTDLTNGNRELEAVYVKDLILYPNCILNIGLAKLYYEEIWLVDNVGGYTLLSEEPVSDVVFENGSSILNIPLLGYSLVVISMDDETTAVNKNEFDLRVSTRIKDESGTGRVNLLKAHRGDGNGVMIMQTRLTDKLASAESVSAKGSFAPASSNEILIEFEYQFLAGYSSDAELVVYISNNKNLGKENIEVARVRPPKANRKGIGDSDADNYALFSGTFVIEDMAFNSGTYIELELRGKNSSVLIDNWDPWVACAGNGDTGTCGDYGGTRSGFEDTVDFTDYLILLSEVGLADPVSANKGCLDLFPDGMVTMEDVSCWGTPYMVCYREAEPDMVSVAQLSIDPNTVDPNTFLPLTVSSLPAYPDKESDIRPISKIYGMMPQGDSIEIKPGYGSGRLVSNSIGELYQLDVKGNVWEYATGRKIITPAVKSYDGIEVTVGTALAGSVILTDMAFDPDNDQSVYVAPVLVDRSYKAAARLELTDTGYEVTDLYGINPATDEGQCITKTVNGEILYEPDTQHIRELEIDNNGYIYVISSHYQNHNSWLLRYDKNTGQYDDCDLLKEYAISLPTTMKMSGNDILYISTSEDVISVDPNNIKLSLYGLNVSQWGSSMNKTETTIRCPAPLDRGIGSYYLSGNYISLITSITEDSSTGNLYVVGYIAPQFNSDTNWSNVNIDSIYTTGFMAEIPYSQIGSTVDAVVIGEDMYSGLRLPMSVVWTGESTEYGCNIADIYPDNKIDLYDFAVLSSYWLSSESMSDIYPMPYGDDMTDISDLAELVDCWMIKWK